MVRCDHHTSAFKAGLTGRSGTRDNARTVGCCLEHLFVGFVGGGGVQMTKWILSVMPSCGQG